MPRKHRWYNFGRSHTATENGRWIPTCHLISLVTYASFDRHGIRFQLFNIFDTPLVNILVSRFTSLCSHENRTYELNPFGRNPYSFYYTRFETDFQTNTGVKIYGNILYHHTFDLRISRTAASSISAVENNNYNNYNTSTLEFFFFFL